VTDGSLSTARILIVFSIASVIDSSARAPARSDLAR
jgi:hypothetical protein